MKKTLYIILSLVAVSMVFNGCIETDQVIQTVPNTTGTGVPTTNTITIINDTGTESESTTGTSDTGDVIIYTTPTSGDSNADGRYDERTYYVSIENNQYNPSFLTVQEGDTVIWTNNDNEQHTVTSDNDDVLNSKRLFRGETYSHTFAQERAYSYHCELHPEMRGTVNVQNNNIN
jgi:plastocyanin